MAAQSPARHSKRVSVACDYCRNKRLKCTADQQPCTNCQLYRVECKNTRVPKQRARQAIASQRRREPSAVEKPTSPDNNHGLSTEAPALGFQDTLSQSGPPSAMPDEGVMEMPSQDTEEDVAMAQTVAPVPLPYGEDEHLDTRHNFLDFSSEMLFPEPFDFWDPEISLHEMISIGGLPDVVPVSYAAPATSTARAIDVVEEQQNPPGGATFDYQRDRNLPVHEFTSPDQAGKISGLQSLKARTGRGDKNKRILPGLFIRKDAFNNNFIGLNSLGATLAFSLREVSESNASLSKAASFDWMIDAGPHVDELDVPWDMTVALIDLPPRSLAAASIEAYFHHVHDFYPVIDGESFRDRWELLYDQEGSDRTMLDISVLCLVVAIGCTYESMRGDEYVQSNNTSSNLFHRVWNLLPLIASRPSLATVQISLLQVVYLLIRRKLGMAWVVCGQAVRAAQSLGLHRKNPRDFDLTEKQTALRSRLWWAAFWLDTTLSLSQGRPTAVQVHCYDTDPLPVTQQQYQGHPHQSVFQMNLFPWIVQLAQIQNQFCGILCRVESVQPRLDALATLDEALREWKNAIPMEARPEQEILVQHDVYPIVAFLHCEYYNMLRSLHWACITSVPPNETILKDHPNPRIQASDLICLSAARQFVKVLCDLTDKAGESHPLIPNLHIEYMIAALAAIYRGTCRNPRRISSKLDLEYFRAGKLYLDREIERTTSKPDYRPLFNAMVTSLREVLD